MSTKQDDSLPPSPELTGAETKANDKRGRWWLVPLFIGVFLCSIVAIALSSAVRDAREATRTAWCTCHGGGQIHLALSVYADEHGSYPPAFVTDANGRRMHSWRALVLPLIDAELAREYNFDEPWDGPNNSKLAYRMPKQFHCPSDFDAPDGTTNYVAVVGKDTMWPLASGRRPSQVTDGAGDTILVVEVKGLNIPWLEPRDLDFATMDFEINGPSRAGIGSHHAGGAFAWMVDGERRFLRNETPAETVRALLTVHGGETIPYRE